MRMTFSHTKSVGVAAIFKTELRAATAELSQYGHTASHETPQLVQKRLLISCYESRWQ